MSDNKDYFLKAIDVVQSIITRMASNSFQVKGWCLTLIIGTFLFQWNSIAIWIAFIPLISFWYLDAYFLHQERLFRKKYEWLTSHSNDPIPQIFDLNVSIFVKQVDSIKKVMISKTLLLLYGSIGIVILIDIFRVIL